MTVWRVGMLAVCVNDNIKPSRRIKTPSCIKKGGVYKVDDVLHDKDGCPWLGFVEIDRDRCILAEYFRPAVQDWQSETQSKTTKLDDLLKVPA